MDIKQHEGWTIHINPDSITATKDGEELTIYVPGKRGLQLMKNAIDRREEDDTLPKS